MTRTISLILLLFFISSCGYKPTSTYTKEILGESIYAEVEISLEDPENSVIIKDAVNEAIVSQFHSIATNKKDATSKLYLVLKSVSFIPIEYDKNGYVTAYKTYVLLQSRYVDRENKNHTITTSGNYDFPIESNSLISDTKRFEAIKFASAKALDELRSKIAIRRIK